jgi:hypothetical protein
MALVLDAPAKLLAFWFHRWVCPLPTVQVLAESDPTTSTNHAPLAMVVIEVEIEVTPEFIAVAAEASGAD